MAIEILEIKEDMLSQYAKIPIAFEVSSMFRVDLVEHLACFEVHNGGRIPGLVVPAVLGHIDDFTLTVSPRDPGIGNACVPVSRENGARLHLDGEGLAVCADDAS
jgi:hypothetical protein